jgi:hypothetical protein
MGDPISSLSLFLYHNSSKSTVFSQKSFFPSVTPPMKSSIIVFLLLFGTSSGSTQEQEQEVTIQSNTTTTRRYLRQQEQRITRKLSATTDPVSGQTVRTYNGIVPIESCPIGYYRPLGSTSRNMVTGQRLDGCLACPRGTYGQAITGTPCVLCPIGTYGDETGLTSVRECQVCLILTKTSIHSLFFILTRTLFPVLSTRTIWYSFWFNNKILYWSLSGRYLPY